MNGIQGALKTLATGRDLEAAVMDAAMTEIMRGEAGDAQIGGLLMALAIKGETVTEIAAAARVMRRMATSVELEYDRLTDIVGTGGDGASLFNVSTTAAFAAASGGARIAKHGNRSVSSKSGAADVLEAAGVNLEMDAGRAAQAVRELGIGFLFAPTHHAAMRHAVAPRRELGLRTMFNLLGPLTNPAGAPCQVLGVFDARWLKPMAEVSRELGSRHVLVVHSEDGLDEFSIAAPTNVAELKDGEVCCWQTSPEELGLKRRSLDALKVRDAGESLTLLRGVLAGEPGPASDMVAMNAGAGLYVAGRAGTLADGVRLAREVIAGGAGQTLLERYAAFSRKET